MMGVKMSEAMGNESRSEVQEDTKTAVSKDITIGDFVRKFPTAVPTLISFGVHCVGCHVAEFETIEQGLMGHGMTSEQVTVAVKKLNEAVEASRKLKPTTGKAVEPSTETIDVTDAAIIKIKALMEKEGKTDVALRIEVIPGGCSGMTYDFSFDDKQTEEDIVVEKNGMKIFVDEASMEYLQGSKVDYIETLHESGFKIENPKAKSGCGCGKSFN